MSRSSKPDPVMLTINSPSQLTSDERVFSVPPASPCCTLIRLFNRTGWKTKPSCRVTQICYSEHCRDCHSRWCRLSHHLGSSLRFKGQSLANFSHSYQVYRERELELTALSHSEVLLASSEHRFPLHGLVIIVLLVLLSLWSFFPKNKYYVTDALWNI